MSYLRGTLNQEQLAELAESAGLSLGAEGA